MTQAMQGTANVTSLDGKNNVASNLITDLITSDAVEVLNTICQCVVKPSILLVGVPSNAVSCAVFWRQGLGDRMNLCLFCLAVTDLLYLVSVCGQSVIGPYVQFVDKLLGTELHLRAIKYSKWFTLEMNTFSTCITLVVAVDRCVCVMDPLRALSYLSSRAMAAILATIYVITQLGHLVNIFRYDVTAVKDNLTNKITGWKWSSATVWNDNYAFFSTLQGVILMTVLPILIFVGIFLTAAMTVGRLRAALLWRKMTSSSSNASQQVALTKMLVFVSCLYIVTSVPYVIFILVGVFVKDFDLGGRYQNSFVVVGIVVIVFSMVKSSCNFFVYYRQSSRFRSDSQSLCCCCCLKLARSPLPSSKLGTATSISLINR